MPWNSQSKSCEKLMASWEVPLLCQLWDSGDGTDILSEAAPGDCGQDGTGAPSARPLPQAWQLSARGRCANRLLSKRPAGSQQSRTLSFRCLHFPACGVSSLFAGTGATYGLLKDSISPGRSLSGVKVHPLSVRHLTTPPCDYLFNQQTSFPSFCY